MDEYRGIEGKLRDLGKSFIDEYLYDIAKYNNLKAQSESVKTAQLANQENGKKAKLSIALSVISIISLILGAVFLKSSSSAKYLRQISETLGYFSLKISKYLSTSGIFRRWHCVISW